MSLLETVTPTVRHAKAATAIGVVTHGDRALLVDSGLDENLARKVVNQLASEGVQVAAVVNTHAHADHCGGNAWVHKRTGCIVCAPHYEHFFVERPDLEPYTLYGAAAPKALQGKFLQAQPSPVHEVVHAEGERDVAGFRVRFHALPGHTVGQMGVEVDDVLFTGDALLPEATLLKYGLPFAVDPLASRESTRRLLDVAPGHVVSYHGGIVDDLAATVRANVERVDAAEQAVLATLAKGPVATEDLVAELVERFAPPNLSVELFALQAATLRGHLSALERAGLAEALVEKGRLLWRARG